MEAQQTSHLKSRYNHATWRALRLTEIQRIDRFEIGGIGPELSSVGGKFSACDLLAYFISGGDPEHPAFFRRR